jgi:uncharacterized DUF497 family protein
MRRNGTQAAYRKWRRPPAQRSGERGRVKIADFGLAKLLGRSADEATLTRVEQVMGTPPAREEAFGHVRAVLLVERLWPAAARTPRRCRSGVCQLLSRDDYGKMLTAADSNVEHIAEHGLTPDDVEAVLLNPVETTISRSSGRPVATGYTPDGRLIFVVFEEIDPTTIYPVTAYEAEE